MSTDTTEKLCVTCYWHSLEATGHRCHCPRIIKKSVVTGVVFAKDCIIERMDYAGQCKEDGIYWEPKDKGV